MEKLEFWWKKGGFDGKIGVSWVFGQEIGEK